ncbi:MAG TPA: hypothetical protein VN539_07320, partial [Candidatus Saccharimonadales bacterium]|nr:hypothetical protein [Candidatus Saccharimonadales bacterium]
MRRFGRKLDVAGLRDELPLTPFFFDLLHVDGQDLLDLPARERFEALTAAAPDWTVPRRVISDPAAANAFLAEALARGHEGVMAKALGAPYEAGRRGMTWIKVKPAHTLDLVVLAVEWGHGRRAGLLSNIHLGARDPVTGAFLMLGKTFKGMTDAMLRWQTRRFQELEVATDGHTVQVRPEVVVEVAFSDVQESPHYPPGWRSGSRGSSATARTRRPPRPTRSRRCARSGPGASAEHVAEVWRIVTECGAGNPGAAAPGTAV